MTCRGHGVYCRLNRSHCFVRQKVRARILHWQQKRGAPRVARRRVAAREVFAWLIAAFRVDGSQEDLELVKVRAVRLGPVWAVAT